MKTQPDRELTLLNELQTKFGYKIFIMRKEKDSFEYVMNFTSGKGHVMRVVRLAVPSTSALGKSLDVKKPKKVKK